MWQPYKTGKNVVYLTIGSVPLFKHALHAHNLYDCLVTDIVLNLYLGPLKKQMEEDAARLSFNFKGFSFSLYAVQKI